MTVNLTTRPNRNDTITMTTPTNPTNLGVPSAAFLDSVRRALGRPDAPPDEPYPPLAADAADLREQAAAVRQRIAAELPDLLTQMAATAALRGWQVQRAANAEDALDYVVSLARRLGATDAARSAQAVFDALPVDAALAGAGVTCWPAVYPPVNPADVASDNAARDAVRRRMAASGLGITGADYAVAETGSVIVLPRQGLSRLVSVVPPVHLAIARPSDIVGTLDDLFILRRLEYHTNGGDMGSYLNFITGPSRTADIEQTIVVGVHGPRAVHLVLLEQE